MLVFLYMPCFFKTERMIPVTVLGPFNEFSKAKVKFILENSWQHVPASKSKSRNTHHY